MAYSDTERMFAELNASLPEGMRRTTDIAAREFVIDYIRLLPEPDRRLVLRYLIDAFPLGEA